MRLRGDHDRGIAGAQGRADELAHRVQEERVRLVELDEVLGRSRSRANRHALRAHRGAVLGACPGSRCSTTQECEPAGPAGPGPLQVFTLDADGAVPQPGGGEQAGADPAPDTHPADAEQRRCLGDAVVARLVGGIRQHAYLRSRCGKNIGHVFLSSPYVSKRNICCNYTTTMLRRQRP